MKVRDKEPEDQPWIEKILSERWGGVKVIAHNEIFDAQSLPALIAGEKDGLATFRIQQRDQIKFAELMTLDAVKTLTLCGFISAAGFESRRFVQVR